MCRSDLFNLHVLLQPHLWVRLRHYLHRRRLLCPSIHLLQRAYQLRAGGRALYELPDGVRLFGRHLLRHRGLLPGHLLYGHLPAQLARGLMHVR